MCVFYQVSQIIHLNSSKYSQKNRPKNGQKLAEKLAEKWPKIGQKTAEKSAENGRKIGQKNGRKMAEEMCPFVLYHTSLFFSLSLAFRRGSNSIVSQMAANAHRFEHDLVLQNNLNFF